MLYLDKYGPTPHNLNPGDPEEHQMTPYELKSLNLPKLTGLTLSIFVRLVASRFGQMILLKSLEDNGGVTKLRSLHVDDPPTFYPLKLSIDSTPNPKESTESPVEGINIPFSTTRDFVQGYQEGRYTPLEIAEQVLENISKSEQGQAPLRLFIAQYREDFFTQAELATQRSQRGNASAPWTVFRWRSKMKWTCCPIPPRSGQPF
jgi:hypothetical protein